MCITVHTMKKALSSVGLMLVAVCLLWFYFRESSTFIPLLDITSKLYSAKGHRSSVPNNDDDDVECGQICSTEFDKQEPGRYYPLLRKRVNCRAIMWRMQHPPGVVHIPPLRSPPNDSVDDFTQHGECQFGEPWYLDDAQPLKKNTFYSKADLQRLLASDNAGEVISHYADPARRLKSTLVRYRDNIRNGHVAVVGTEMPWAEAMLINQGARRITTLEYRELTINDSRIVTITPSKFAEKYLNATKAGKTIDLFDVVFSYSSLEHSGLGRYGDPLAPYGDAEAVAQMWCAVRPGGLFFVGIPVFPRDEDRRRLCRIRWNALRTYGYPRLQHVTANWEVLKEVNVGDSLPHFIYVLRKLESMY